MSEHSADPLPNRDAVAVEPGRRSPTTNSAEAFERLIPQLTSSSLPPTRAELVHMVDNAATVLLLARVDGAIMGSLTLAFYRIPPG